MNADDDEAWVAGVDGCRGGWLALWLQAAGGRAAAAVPARRWVELDLAAARLVAVDMPVGLAEAGPRACDKAARALLPAGRKSSVFPPPRRYMLACGSWPAANAEGRRRENVGLGRQSWNITNKIAELDAALAPADQAWLREAHPELVFHHLNGWRPLPRKRGAEGRRRRLALLAAAGARGLARLLQGRPGGVRPDDVLDAAACALAARRMLAGEAACLPAAPPRDRRGLRMEIWY